MELSLINSVEDAAAHSSLQNCCGAENWVKQMMAARPFASDEELFNKASSIWWQLAPADWLEAFTHHPKIGDFESLSKKFASTAQWAAGEQASVASANEQILHELAAGNTAYENKFGYIFIVCASGKSATEMLAILKSRLPNESEAELRIAAGEQEKITKLRLEKLCQ